MFPSIVHYFWHPCESFVMPGKARKCPQLRLVYTFCAVTVAVRYRCSIWHIVKTVCCITCRPSMIVALSTEPVVCLLWTVCISWWLFSLFCEESLQSFNGHDSVSWKSINWCLCCVFSGPRFVDYWRQLFLWRRIFRWSKPFWQSMNKLQFLFFFWDLSRVFSTKMCCILYVYLILLELGFLLCFTLLIR